MSVIDWAERRWVPDPLLRVGIRRLIGQRLVSERRQVAANPTHFEQQIERLRRSPVAIETAAANRQHYEVPPAFFEAVLGPHLKYSCCLWEAGTDRLADAERAMIERTATRAGLADGQKILDLGCGWGSLSLWAAERFPGSRITAVSNSSDQRRFIETAARERGLENLSVRTADANTLDFDQRFDRVVSVEMFEHMRNYASLMARIARWLEPDGRLFVHIFCHDHLMYPFETEGAGNWMGRHFFTGGLMPAFDTLSHFQDDLRLIESWRVNGRHYERTSNAWLDNLDAAEDGLTALFSADLGADEARRQLQRWRMFFMACAELFGYRDGGEWGVGHYLFAPRANR